MSRLILLDNEAVQALADPEHPKHRRALSHIQVVARRKARQIPIRVAVPTGVRVEAGYSRTEATNAFLGRLRVSDVPLDTATANVAADIVSRAAVSVADAHLGAVMQMVANEQLTVITSDPDDMRAVAGTAGVTVVVI
ncbi:hypothetical protein BH20ACT7_BH20ACT7_20010 [soil metagenome]